MTDNLSLAVVMLMKDVPCVESADSSFLKPAIKARRVTSRLSEACPRPRLGRKTYWHKDKARLTGNRNYIILLLESEQGWTWSSWELWCLARNLGRSWRKGTALRQASSLKAMETAAKQKVCKDERRSEAGPKASLKGLRATKLKTKQIFKDEAARQAWRQALKRASRVARLSKFGTKHLEAGLEAGLGLWRLEPNNILVFIYIYIFIYLFIYMGIYKYIYIYIPKKGSDFGPKKARKSRRANMGLLQYLIKMRFQNQGLKTRSFAVTHGGVPPQCIRIYIYIIYTFLFF